MNRTESALYTATGLIQYAPTVADMLAEYNRHGKLYEVRTVEGVEQLWHKGHNRMVGEFRTVTRAALGGAK